MYNVALLESQVLRELPHLGMALLHSDLKARKNVKVHAACVGLNNTAAALDFLEQGRFDLVAMDCRFPLVFPSQIKQRLPGALVVVGGLGYYNMLTKGRADFAVSGPGRLALRRLIDVLTGINGTRLSDVPNLFHWIDRPTSGVGPGGGPIDYSGLDAGYDLESELQPFTPDFDFTPLGMDTQQEMAQVLDTAPPAVVAEFGCPHKGFAMADSLPAPDLEPTEAVFTSRGREKIISIMNERWKGGCSFCVYQKAPIRSVAETVETLIPQIEYLQKARGFTAFSVQSEEPFRFLIPLLERLNDSGLEVHQLLIRGRAASFHRQRAKLEQAVDLARSGDYPLVSWQIGFESFCQPQLDLYNKGTSAEENLSVLRFNRELARRHPRHFLDLNITHGMILWNPWTTFEMLKEDFSVICRYMPERLVLSPVIGSTLELFDPFLPLYQKARNEGLLRKREQGTDDFRMADPSMEVVRQVVVRTLARIDKDLPHDLRNEVALFAPTIAHIFAAVFQQLEEQYFKPGAVDAAWHENMDQDQLDRETGRRVDRFMILEEKVVQDNLSDRVIFVHAVREIHFFAERLQGQGDSARLPARSNAAETVAGQEQLNGDFARLDGPWDFQIRHSAEKAFVIDLATDEMTPMDRVMFAFIQIKIQGMDLGGIVDAVLQRDSSLDQLILDRGRRAHEFLSASRSPA